MAPIIEARDIHKKFEDGTAALRGVSFSVERGEFLAIMGPSGSGKSTLLHILGFLDEQTAGKYLFAGYELKNLDKDEAAKVRNEEMGFVFQAFNLLPRTNVLENVKLPLLYSKMPEKEWEKKALSAILSVGLSHRLEHETNQLSGGEKQRVAIARALVNDPQVIFADEPTGNLDSKSGQAVMNVLEKLNKEGRTIVLITHETYTAEHADRIIHILDGKVDKDYKVANKRAGDGTFLK